MDFKNSSHYDKNNENIKICVIGAGVWLVYGGHLNLRCFFSYLHLMHQILTPTIFFQSQLMV